MNSLIPTKSASQGKNEVMGYYTDSTKHDFEGNGHFSDQSSKRNGYYKSQSLRNSHQNSSSPLQNQIQRSQNSQQELIRSPTTPHKNQHFLKAAILSNARKNKEENSAKLRGRTIYNYEDLQKTEDSVELDVGNDVCPVKMYFDQVNTKLAQKHPGKSGMCMTHR